MNDTVPPPSSRFERPFVPQPSLSACLRAISASAVYRTFIIHLVVMIPATVLMCVFAIELEGALRFDWPLGQTPSLGLGAGSLL